MAVIAVGVGVAFFSNPDDDATSAPADQEPTPGISSEPEPDPASEPTVTVPTSRTITEVGRRVLGVHGDWELFARGPGVVVRIELARGRVTRTKVPELRSSGPATLLVGRDRVLIDPLDFVPGYAVYDRGPVRELPGDSAHGGMLVPGPKAGQVWRFRDRGEASRMALTTMDGERVGPSISLPAGVFSPSPDGAGEVMLSAPGGVYQARADGFRRITTGMVLAAGPTGWLTLECDDQWRCLRVLVERADRSRHVLGEVPTGADDRQVDGAIAPDGSTAAVMVRAGDSGWPSLHLIDLKTGEDRTVEVSLSSESSRNALAWSPDSRYLFTTSNDGTLLAIDSSTGEPQRLGISLPPLTQVAVRNATS